jgi:flavin reductase (DIM6/NTAB) family NADH-FMN oxidoreductase RutF
MSQAAAAGQRVSLPVASVDLETVERDDFISAMALAVNGVSIVTTDGEAGRFGITVSSVSSVSADPPLMLVCVNRKSPAHQALRENMVFCVNLLSTQDRELADTFAGRPTRGQAFEFAAGAWSPGVTGAPRLTHAVSAFECVMEQSHDAGSHTVFIGRVVAVVSTGAHPLLYTDRAYGFACRLN